MRNDERTLPVSTIGTGPPFRLPLQNTPFLRKNIVFTAPLVS